MSKTEKIAKSIYHKEFQEPLWVNLSKDRKNKYIHMVEDLHRANRMFQSSAAKMAEEAFRRVWKNSSDDQKSRYFDLTHWYLEAKRKLK